MSLQSLRARRARQSCLSWDCFVASLLAMTLHMVRLYYCGRIRFWFIARNAEEKSIPKASAFRVGVKYCNAVLNLIFHFVLLVLRGLKPD